MKHIEEDGYVFRDITVKNLRTLLNDERLRDDDVLEANMLQNLVIIRDDTYWGVIEIGSEEIVEDE